MLKLQGENQKLAKLAAILKNSGISIFEYDSEKDELVVYDHDLQIMDRIQDYVNMYMPTKSRIYPEDRKKAEELYNGIRKDPIEIREVQDDGSIRRKVIEGIWMEDSDTGRQSFVGSVKDVTQEKEKEDVLKDKIKRDALTSLYHNISGRHLIDEYLSHKDPYDSCGLVVLDIDYFKAVNDTYGHLFGDKVLKALANLMKKQFSEEKEIILRVGGDEFVIFFKNVSNIELVRKIVELRDGISKIQFPESDYVMTCSIGVCYLPQNISGYTYNQLFENADWALYQAKEKGRNCYVFCDNLQRFEIAAENKKAEDMGIDARYLRNDVVSTAFEIFEKTHSFEVALELLMKVIGARFYLDRITVVQTNVKDKMVGKNYQWRSPRAPEVLKTNDTFMKEDFLTLFHSYDEYGTCVLQHDNMGMYSEQARRLLMQGEAKTVVYAAMYCEGQYTGAISYVVCDKKRQWSKEKLRQLSEVTKIISAHLAKNQMMNHVYQGIAPQLEHDPLTGLIAFNRFHEEVERIIVGNKESAFIMLYMDFQNFKYFNYRYGYEVGDQVLKEFCNHIIRSVEGQSDIYFTRIVADQFLLFKPTAYSAEEIEKGNIGIKEEIMGFATEQKEKFPQASLRIRAGIYYITPQCVSAGFAIDASNYARCQIKSTEKSTIKLYNDEMKKKHHLESKIINDMQSAIKNHQFKVYLQPKYSLKDSKVSGAEALVRWEREDGEILYPDAFIPVYEEYGQILDLDLYVFEQVVNFLAKNKKMGRKQVPISINASGLHGKDSKTVQKYLSVLKQYEIDSSLVEIELTETSLVQDYENIKQMFSELKERGIKIVLDDFGSGYSVLNTIVDLPIDIIKIDRGFMNSCTMSQKGSRFLEQIIKMIRQLGYGIVCEGVETIEQVEFLRKAKCDEIQGYWYAKPMSIPEYEKRFYGENGINIVDEEKPF